jgi:streptogramin lyase
LVGTYAVGIFPDAICYGNGSIWVANVMGDDVTELNASDSSLIGTFVTGSGPSGCCYAGNSIWVSNYFSNNITKLSAGVT